MKQKYIFGPIPSRRLGLSLGLDLIDFKTCTLDCCYCECGKTTNLSIERKEFVPTKKLMAELAQVLKELPKLDYITFSGSGEPTLASNIGEIILQIKNKWPDYKIAVLTNGTLIHLPEISQSLMAADLVVPSLDAATQNIFEIINGPHSQLKLNEIVYGLIDFSKLFKGEIWMEVFIIPGINDDQESLDRIKNILMKIKPNKIQLNTLDRPGTANWVKSASYDELERIADYLGSLKTEIVSNKIKVNNVSPLNISKESMILNTIKRRPCTADDLQRMCQLKPVELNKYIRRMLHKKLIRIERQERGEFFCISEVVTK